MALAINNVEFASLFRALRLDTLSISRPGNFIFDIKKPRLTKGFPPQLSHFPEARTRYACSSSYSVYSIPTSLPKSLKDPEFTRSQSTISFKGPLVPLRKTRAVSPSPFPVSTILFWNYRGASAPSLLCPKEVPPSSSLRARRDIIFCSLRSRSRTPPYWLRDTMLMIKSRLSLCGLTRGARSLGLRVYRLLDGGVWGRGRPTGVGLGGLGRRG